MANSQALLQAVLAEALPCWLHVAPPCAFWCDISRWAAHATAEPWGTVRAKARAHWCFALHLLSLQEARGATGSSEQPPRCVSRKFGMTRCCPGTQPTCFVAAMSLASTCQPCAARRLPLQRDVRGQRRPICGRPQGIPCIFAATPNLAGVSREPLAFVCRHPAKQALACCCWHSCGGALKHP